MFKPHHPPHLYIDNKIYFITTRTVDKKPFFDGEKKQILSKTINDASNKFQINIYAWVILDNHYHLLAKIQSGKMLPEFIKSIHGKSAFLLNKLEKISKRKIWFNYWDQCVRDESDFWKHFNYIHHNPVKHGYVNSQPQASDYPFCSYQQWLKKNGEEWLSSCFEKYPIIDFTTADI